MKNGMKLTALLLCAALMLSLMACTAKPAETTAPTTLPVTEPPATTVPVEQTAAELYIEAVVALEKTQTLTMELQIMTHTNVDDDELSEQSAQTLTFKAMDTENALIVLEETLDFGVHSEHYDPEESGSIHYTEIWNQGTVYAQLEDGYRFSGALDPQAAVNRYIPIGLFTTALYGSIVAETSAEGTVITFSEPTGAESWAMPEEGELLEASGTAVVNADGALKEMEYALTYRNGPAEITVEVTSSPWDIPRTVTAPADPENYVPIDYVDALRISTVVPAMLFQTDSLSFTGMQSIFCQAAGVMQNQSTQVQLHGRREDTQAKIDTDIFFMDYSTGQSEEYALEETFRDGKLTSVVNGGLPTTNSGVSWEDVRTFASETVVQGILEMDFWENVTASDMGSVYLLEYQLNDNFGNTMQNDICEMLWEDPSFLYNLASEYKNVEVNGYLSVDKYTGIPVAAGYYYEGIHTIDGVDYTMTMQYDQSMEAPAKGAYREITDQMPEEEEPAQKASPLFYHVTGEEGQELWLFGTIHVGDERTAYLPEEIYDAFAASDALALECDTEAFEQQLEEDDALAEQVSGLYFYAGGLSSIKGLMEEEDYAQALKLLKAVGGYNMNMTYAKPYLWSNTIDQFYLRQGYQLHGDQGVEERLCAWAEELDKEILEVESSLFQIRMLTGFSNELQMLMLEESMELTAREYWENTMDLYEKWCAGDEAVLREELSDEVDTSEMTEEELAEYEEQKHLLDEYNKAISHDRNDGMLAKAIEYLESGDVIFYAVGLAHLLNDTNGLVDTLRDAGYTVELVTYAQ